MSKRIYIYCFFLTLLLLSCSEKNLFEEGEGTVSLNVSLQKDLPIIATRATLTDDELLQKCKVYVRNDKGLVRKFASLAEVPKQGIQLIVGNYKAEIMAGDSVSASFTDSYFKGSKDFAITQGKDVAVSVECKIQNVVTCVSLADDLTEAFSSYSITLNTSQGKLVYTPDNINDAGYFMLSSDDKQLSWAFEGTMKDKTLISKKGTVDKLKKSTKYVLKFSNSPSEVGGGMITVTVEFKDLDIPTADLEVELDARPIIKLLSDGEDKKWIDFETPLYRPQMSYESPVVLGAGANSTLKSILVYSSSFQQIDSEFPASATGYDFLAMDAKEVENLRNLGLEFNTSNEGKSATITFSESLRKKMVANAGTYKFDITVVDTKGNSRMKTLTLMVTNLCVATEEVKVADVWTNRATLRGRILDDKNVKNYRFRYRKAGETTWTEIKDGIVRDNNSLEYTCIVTGLESTFETGVKYEYQAIDDTSDEAFLITSLFETESSRQLPNSGFEEWSGSAPLYIFKNGGVMFWDSGNTGSSTMDKNVTTNDSGVKHSGNYSAKLQSQFVGVGGFIGKFAAGNIFVGKYLWTDGMDGVLRFGRPFTSRPTRLILYYKYISGKIDNTEEPYKGLNGKMDSGHVYVALGDWAYDTDSKTGETNIPVLVKTKSKNLFDPNSQSIIGFGEHELKESSVGDGMVKLEIEINYRTTSRKPKDIIVVGTASKYGDYFTGSTGSTLWLDDLELIYE